VGFLDHVWAEVREGGGVFLRTWWNMVRGTALLFLLLGLAVVVPDPELSLAAGAFLALVAAPLYGAFQGLTLGLPVAVLAVLYRILGWTVALPVVAVLGGVLVAGWMGKNIVGLAMVLVGQALGERTQDLQALPGARVGHPVALLVLIPMMLLHYGTDPAVLAAVLWLTLVVTLVLGAGALGGLLVSLPPVLVVTAGRLKERAAAREAAASAGD
jgi:hypothetical protein